MNNNNSKLLNGGLDMKITKIDCPHNEFIDLSLSKGIINDFAYDDTIFTIHIEDVEPIDFLYRRMYEELYLKRDCCYTCSKIPENGKMELRISLSEAIAFIKSALPPVFKPREKEAYESINDVKETLLALLDGGDSQYEYMTLFKKCLGLNYFETKTEYNRERMQLLRQFESTAPVVDVIVSPLSSEELYEGIEGDELEDYEGSLYREITGVNLHFMFNCMRKSELELIYKIIKEADYYYLNKCCQVHILNIFHEEFGGYYVEMYIENFDSEICKTLYEIYQKSYKKILGK